MNYILFFLGILQLTVVAAQQNQVKEIEVERLLENLVEQQLDTDNAEAQYESLLQHYYNPLNLNKCEPFELEELYLLSSIEIESFFEYRTQFGPLSSIYELQAIPNWSLEIIYKILPFVQVKEKLDLQKFMKRIQTNKNHFLAIRTDFVLEQKKGYMKNEYGATPYLGSPFKHILRYKNSNTRDFSFGFTLEKDAGEVLELKPKENKYVFDYYSFHLGIMEKGKVKSFLLGDFTLQFGQGLVLGGGFFIGKGAETILSVKKPSKGIMPYSSVIESGFFRGVASTVAIIKGVELTGFYSNQRYDTNEKYDSISSQVVVSSILTDGYHRTNDELSKQNKLNEQTVGGNMSLVTKNKKFKIGYTVVRSDFNKRISETDHIYNRFDFKGKYASVSGINFSIIVKNSTLFGEVAMSSITSTALVMGCMTSLSRMLDVAVLYRDYDRDFHSIYANAFAEGSSINNERGLYYGIKLKVHAMWIASAYYDSYKFPWLKYFKDSPSEGHGYLGRLQFIPSKKTTLYYQLRFEENGKNQSDNHTNIDFVVPTTKYNSSLNVESTMGLVSFRTRVQWSRYQQSNNPTNGFLLAQDLTLSIKTLKLSTRFALFDTEDYDNRQYNYEKDVLYAVSIPAYNGRGLRYTLMTQYKLGKKMDLWVRYARTSYFDKTVIGSGNEAIQGNKLTEVKFQVRFRF